ncbi:MAG TPA: NAD-dependent epimerase/dehydratase family protein [Solirubrobacteraceae bacterium]|nr:NAD-dependent epimerase/dehydratase family protein [Solirubrobacteraceae bacterium]
MKVFVTGPTGQLGGAVADVLKREGHHVVGLARDEDAVATLASRAIEPVLGDLADTHLLAEQAARADGVIHVAVTGDEHQAEVDVAATTSMLDALAGSGSPYVHTSGGWVLGNTGAGPADEDAPIAVAEAIAWRPPLERTVRAAADRDVRSVVIRPAIMFGHGRGLPAMYVGWARERGVGRCVGDGENRWTFVHVEDLAELYCLALERAPAGTLLNGSSGETLAQSELARAADRAAGGEGNFEPWPLTEARETLGVLADALALDQNISGERARHTLGWSPTRFGVAEEVQHGSYRLALARS